MEKKENQKKKKVINFDEWEPENKKFKPRNFVTIYPDGTTTGGIIEKGKKRVPPKEE